MTARIEQVTGLENLPPIDEPVLVCANHMSWFDVPSLHGFLGGRLLWSFAKAELVKVSHAPPPPASP